MKSLKLDHNLAQRILKGTLSTTWRLYDDKDLSVNDTVTLIDKVQPEDEHTWRLIGTAHIDTIIQKRLGDVAEDDMGGRPYASRQTMLETFQKYYGRQVDFSTPVKIIQFTFTPKGDHLAEVDAIKTTKITEVKLFADGGSRGNPGPSASGFVLLDMQERIIVKEGVYLGLTTNNQAEYQALKLGLEAAKKMQAQTVHVYLDSLLVVNQMLGIFKVKNRDLWPIHESIKELAATFKHVNYTHVPRAFNKLADAAVNEALDAAARNQKQ